MRKIKILGLLLMALVFATPAANAGGVSIGGFPGTGYTVNFGSGGATGFIPIRFEVETFMGADNHGIGGSLGFDIGTGFAPNIFVINPQYRYYFNDGRSSSPFVGATVDIGFGSSKSLKFGAGAIGGYQHFFNDNIAIYGAATLGYAAVKVFNTRSSGELGFRAGVKFLVK